MQPHLETMLTSNAGAKPSSNLTTKKHNHKRMGETNTHPVSRLEVNI